MLNNNGIKKELNKNIFVDDIREEDIGKNYVNVYLGNKLKVYENTVLDIKKPNETRTIEIPEEGYILEPNKLYLGSTNKFTKTYNYVPLLAGLEELAALGVEIHVTAGFGDNGFEGTWTLEIICTNPTILYPNMLIGKVYYHPLVGDPSIKYQGKYLGQIDPTESRMQKDYTKKLTKGGK